MVFLAKGEGSHIHYFKIFVYSLHKGKMFILGSLWIFLWVSCIDTIYTGTFENHIGIDFYRAEYRSRIGSKVWVPCTCPEDDHAPFFQVAYRPTTDKRLCNGLHRNGRL